MYYKLSWKLWLQEIRNDFFRYCKEKRNVSCDNEQETGILKDVLEDVVEYIRIQFQKLLTKYNQILLIFVIGEYLIT